MESGFWTGPFKRSDPSPILRRGCCSTPSLRPTALNFRGFTLHHVPRTWIIVTWPPFRDFVVGTFYNGGNPWNKTRSSPVKIIRQAPIYKKMYVWWLIGKEKKNLRHKVGKFVSFDSRATFQFVVAITSSRSMINWLRHGHLKNDTILPVFPLDGFGVIKLHIAERLSIKRERKGGKKDPLNTFFSTGFLELDALLGICGIKYWSKANTDLCRIISSGL